MKRLHTFVVLTVLGCIGFASQQAEGALAQAGGGSGLSGTLSKNKAIRKQQLIADPAEPTEGSISVSYDPSVVTVSGALFGPGYQGNVYVEADSDGYTFLMPLDSFLAYSNLYAETGYIQVFFYDPALIVPSFVPAAPSPHGQITPPAGYTVIANDGPPGVDTHALFFDYLDDVPDDTVATYSIFAAPGDYLSDGITTIPHTAIARAQVSGSLDSLPAVPVPAAVWIGGMTLIGSLGYTKVRRGRIA